jgi:hypothetical protein
LLVYIMYVDESGDPGLHDSPTRYLVLCGFVVPEVMWHDYLGRMVAFRRRMRDKYGLSLRDELHTAHFITRPGAQLAKISRNDRLAILRHFGHELTQMDEARVITVIVDKLGKAADYDPFVQGWRALIQRFNNTLKYRNFPLSDKCANLGMILPDETDAKRLRTLTRRMRQYNPVPFGSGSGARNLPLSQIIEDPGLRESRHSYFVQAADLCAYLMRQGYEPNVYMRKKGAASLYKKLDPIICHEARPGDPWGRVPL